MTRCGHVALAGRPNVGKSTLMNHLLGIKLAITSRKPQTTRHALIGILNHEDAQVIFVDTPGIHVPRRALNRYMVDQAVGSLTGVDLAVMLIEGSGWQAGDDVVLDRDRQGRRAVPLRHQQDRPAADQGPSTAADRRRSPPAHLRSHRTGVGAAQRRLRCALTTEIVERLPEAPRLYDDDEVTDRSLEFLIGEIVREKAMRRLGAELPHQTAVTVEDITRRQGCTDVHAVIYVERASQKRIAIGKGGMMLKSIGEDARKDIEALIAEKAMLRLWVKVAPHWSERPGTLNRFGYQARDRQLS